MKICYFGNPQSIHLERWMRYFIDRGHEVHVVTPEPAEIKGAHVHEIPYSAFYDEPTSFWYKLRGIGHLLNILRQRQLVSEIKRTLKNIGADILDAHYLTYYGVIASHLDFHPLVITIWGSDILVDPEKYGGKRLNLMSKALNKADMVLCFGRRACEAVKRLGKDPEKIRPAPLGVDTQRFRPQPKDARLIWEWDAADSPVVISTRNLEPIYDVAAFVRAMPLVLSQAGDARFVIASDGSQRAHLEALASSIGVGEKARFVGRLDHDELPRYLATADIYVSTSVSDGASASLVEAMACGLAVVTTNAGDAPKWVKSGQNGFVVPLDSPEKLAEKIAHLLKDDQLRQKAGEVNRALATEKADYQREMRKIEELYTELKEKFEKAAG